MKIYPFAPIVSNFQRFPLTAAREDKSVSTSSSLIIPERASSPGVGEGCGQQNLRLILLRQIPEDETLRCQWNALLDRTLDPQVFYTYEWSLAVQRAYADSLNPFVVLGYDEQDTLCGVAALATNSTEDQISFLCATTADYCEFLSLPNYGRAFAVAVIAEVKRQGIGRMAFANIPANSDTLTHIRQATRQLHCWCFARVGYVCAHISLGRLERNREGKAVAPGLKRVRRFVNAMSREAPVRFEHHRSWDEMNPILPQFVQAHVARFLETGRISNIAENRRRVFLAELAGLLSRKHWMVLSRMRAGERTVAWHYGFQFHGSWFWYQPTFDGSFEKFWPGFCLLSHVIQEALANPKMMTVDLGLGPEAYKAKFANGSRETFYVTLHSSFLDHLRTVFRYRIAEAVRTYPPIERLVDKLRKNARAFRSRLRHDGFQQTLAETIRRAVKLIWRRDEIFFYELTGVRPAAETPSYPPSRIDLNLLARAAMQYCDDEETLTYLLRCAKRLRAKEYTGFAFVNEDGQPVHFTWVGPFTGFHCAELDTRLECPSPGAAMLFDSWTPRSQRGRGHYGLALRLVAACMQQSGKQPWVFTASSNASSVRGLQKLGIPRRFSIVRGKVLWWQWLRRHETESAIHAERLVA